MKRLLTLAILTILLTACSKTISFDVKFDTTDTIRRQELEVAVKRVVEGRLLAKKKEPGKIELREESGNTFFIVTVPDAESADLLRSGLTTPFTMSIMKQVEKGQGDLISEKYGEFKETGIDTAAFDWVSPGEAVTPGKSSVVLHFTTKGQETLKQVFSQNLGQVIGVFVRGQLMSRKLIDKKDAQETITIDGIPSSQIAQGFSDDVNTGLHVSFTPRD